MNSFGTSNKNYGLDKSNLYIKRLWGDCNQIDLDDIFRSYGFIVQSRVCGNGVGFVRYENSVQAYEAMTSLNNKKPHPKSKEPLIIRYAYKKLKQPKSEISVGIDKIQIFMHDNNKNVYIRNIPSFYNKSDLFNICKVYGLISNVKLCDDINKINSRNCYYNYAFTRFSTQDGAINCIHSLHGKFLHKSHLPLIVKYANSDPFESSFDFQTSSPSLGQTINNDACAIADNTISRTLSSMY